MKDDKQMMEDEAQWVTMQLLRGQGGLRGRADTAAAYCTICAFVAMLVSFRALMALTILFLLLLVEGWDENANTQSEHIRHTHIEKDALELKHAFQETGLMLVEAPGLLRANRVNERVSATEWPLDHPLLLPH